MRCRKGLGPPGASWRRPETQPRSTPKYRGRHQGLPRCSLSTSRPAKWSSRSPTRCSSVPGPKGDLDSPDGWMFVDGDLSMVLSLLEPPADPSLRPPSASRPPTRACSPELRARRRRHAPPPRPSSGWPALGAGRSPTSTGRRRSSSVPAAPTAATRAAPATGHLRRPQRQHGTRLRPAVDVGLGPVRESTWTVRDEDAYRGLFTRSTANPVLVVGNYWDPATNYQGAVKASNAAAHQLAAEQQQVGAHGLRHVGLRHERGPPLPAHQARAGRRHGPASVTPSRSPTRSGAPLPRSAQGAKRCPGLSCRRFRVTAAPRGPPVLGGCAHATPGFVWAHPASDAGAMPSLFSHVGAR